MLERRTSLAKASHVEDNLGAVRGRLPDDRLRDRIARDLS